MHCPWPIYPMHTTGILQCTVNAFGLSRKHSVTHWVCISHSTTQLLWSACLCHAVTLLHCMSECIRVTFTIHINSYILDYFLRSKIILHSLCHSPGVDVSSQSEVSLVRLVYLKHYDYSYSLYQSHYRPSHTRVSSWYSTDTDRSYTKILSSQSRTKRPRAAVGRGSSQAEYSWLG